MPAILLFPFGLVLGSFATAVAHRLPRGESVVGGRSRCPVCREQIASYDNVPVLSWLALRGRCRRCGEPISPRYPATELAMALLFTLTAAVLGTGDPVALALGLTLCATLLIVTLTDLERRVIPNAVLGVSAVIALAIVVAFEPTTLGSRAIASLAAGGLLLAVALAYPRGMGMGDVKLATLLGLFLGRAVVPALAVATVAGALVGLALMLRHGPGARKSAVPFGPFLALGGIVGLLAGDELLDAYLDAFVRSG